MLVCQSHPKFISPRFVDEILDRTDGAVLTAMVQAGSLSGKPNLPQSVPGVRNTSQHLNLHVLLYRIHIIFIYIIYYIRITLVASGDLGVVSSCMIFLSKTKKIKPHILAMPYDSDPNLATCFCNLLHTSCADTSECNLN